MPARIARYPSKRHALTQGELDAIEAQCEHGNRAEDLQNHPRRRRASAVLRPTGDAAAMVELAPQRAGMVSTGACGTVPDAESDENIIRNMNMRLDARSRSSTQNQESR